MKKLDTILLIFAIIGSYSMIGYLVFKVDSDNKKVIEASKKIQLNQLFFNTEVVYADSNIIVLKPIK